MKKGKRDDLRVEYKREDLGKGVRGKHYKSFKRGHNLVLLRPEVAAAFPTEGAVNEALSSLITVARRSVGAKHRSPRNGGHHA